MTDTNFATPSGDQGATPAPATSGGDAGNQGGGMPSGQTPAGQLPSGAGNWDPENLRQYGRSIFGEGHSDEATEKLAQDAEQQARPGEQPQAAPPPDLARWAELGEYDQVKENIGLVNHLLSDSPRDFWANLQGRDADRLVGVLDAAMEAFGPAFFIDALHKNGQLPEVSSAELAVIDQKFHEMYPLLSPQERYEIQMQDDPDAQWDLLEHHLKNFEHDRQIDEHEKQFNDYQAQQRQERAHQLFEDIRGSVVAGIGAEIRGDLTQLVGSPELADEAGAILFSWAEQKVVSDPANRRQLELLDRAIHSGNKNEAMRLALPLQAKTGKLIRSFLDKFGGASNGNPAPSPAPLPGRSSAQQGADRVDKVLDRAMPAQTDSDITEESARMERYRRISRQIFG